jgi:hypothetical protein
MAKLTVAFHNSAKTPKEKNGQLKQGSAREV